MAIELKGDGTLVIAGRLDAAQAAAAMSSLERVHGKVTVDCGGLEYISSAGLGVLLKTHKRLLGAAGGLKLCRLRPNVRDVLVYSGFDQIFEIER
ncbi:MAG TPA: STAS domain-containing protein [Casimicrobiaceae bacterium]|nr:STAS domain-containing protein [Casimicrobiaceae bacterium]